MSTLPVQNHRAFDTTAIPFLTASEFRLVLEKGLSKQWRMIGLFPVSVTSDVKHVVAVLADPFDATIHLAGTSYNDKIPAYESLARRYPQTNYFECELAENWGIVPLQHPWLRPVRQQNTILGSRVYEFYQMKGEEVHEVAVGPIHAGVIEPGHFRFQCHGELVYHLEINLGYQHRGIEKLFLSANENQRMILAESIAGDSSIGHALAYALVLEGLSNTAVSLRAQVVRSIAEELERIAMHLAGLAGIANDIGLAIGAASYGRLRTLVINSLAHLCGSRFGRGLIVPGGVRFDFDEKNLKRIKENLIEVQKSLRPINDFFFNSTSVLARLEHTGTVSEKWAKEIGMVGPAARACGVEIDTRSQFPYSAYRYYPVSMMTLSDGDIYARARIRSMEIDESMRFIFERLEDLPNGELHVACHSAGKDSGVVSLTEGWRGEIAHCAFTNTNGDIVTYKIKDPSFHNWYGLGLAMRQQQISDFPLCNKSFDLSYAGHDL